jgi:hypothetical protein
MEGWMPGRVKVEMLSWATSQGSGGSQRFEKKENLFVRWNGMGRGNSEPPKGERSSVSFR